MHGINGRKMYETWFQAEALMRDPRVDLSPVITHRLPLAKFDEAMKLLESGEASKILLNVRGVGQRSERACARQTLRLSTCKLRGILHDKLIGEPEMDDAFSGNDDVAVACGPGEKRASAGA